MDNILFFASKNSVSGLGLTSIGERSPATKLPLYRFLVDMPDLTGNILDHRYPASMRSKDPTLLDADSEC